MRKLVIFAAIVVLCVLYLRGTFDQALVHVGLNAKPCVHNVFGADFCGSEAKEYCENLHTEAGACASFTSTETTSTQAEPEPAQEGGLPKCKTPSESGCIEPGTG